MINKPPKILVIKSDVSELKNVEFFLKNVLDEFNLTQKYFNKIYLCISEAVINSIKHGNKNDLNKSVSIGINCNKNLINVDIEDEGEGFDFKNVEDPTLKSNLKKESGRGILLIKNMCDTLEYNQKGNRLQIKINCK